MMENYRLKFNISGFILNKKGVLKIGCVYRFFTQFISEVYKNDN